MASNLPTWLKNPVLVGLTSVAMSTLVSMNVVQYTTGNTYQAGTLEATVLSGATVVAGGGLTTIGTNGNAQYPTLEAATVSGVTIRTQDAHVILNNNGVDATNISGSTIRAAVAFSGATFNNNNMKFSVRTTGIVNADTFSGGTLKATVSMTGATYTNGNGTFTVSAAGVVEGSTVSGATVRAKTLTGTTIGIGGLLTAAKSGVLCQKTDNTIGYMLRTATGSLSWVCN